MKTFDEPVSGKLTLDVRGFKFLNSRGTYLDVYAISVHVFSILWYIDATAYTSAV